MDRCSESTKAVDLFGSGKHGYTEGDDNVVPPTIIGASALNQIQEEIVRAIESVGLSPSSVDLGQLALALRGGPPIATYGWPSGTGSLTSGQIFPLTAGTGSLAPASIYTLSSNKVKVSEKGVYRVTLATLFTATSAHDSLFAKICTTPGLVFYVGNTTEDTADEEAYLSASILVALDVNDEVWLENGTATAVGGGVAFGTTYSQFSIEQVKKL